MGTHVSISLVIQYLASECERCLGVVELSSVVERCLVVEHRLVVLSFIILPRVQALSFLCAAACTKEMPKTRSSRCAGRARGRGRGGPKPRSTRSSATHGPGPCRGDNSVSDSSVAPRLGSPARSPPSDGNATLNNLLQTVREEVREQLAMQAADCGPPSSLAGPPVTTSSTSDVVSSPDSG